MRTLTKAEEQIMQKLWELEKAHVKNIIAELPLPKPAYNTVSTIIRILEKKGFVDHRAHGKTHEYYPLVTKTAYRKTFFSHFFQNYFSNSYLSFTSFFAKNQNLSLEELAEMQKIIEEEIKKKNNL